MNLDVEQIKKDVKKTGLYTAGYSASVLLGTPLGYRIEQFFPESQRVLTSPYAWETFKTEPLVTFIAAPMFLGLAIMVLLFIAVVLDVRYTTGDSE